MLTADHPMYSLEYSDQETRIFVDARFYAVFSAHFLISSRYISRIFVTYLPCTYHSIAKSGPGDSDILRYFHAVYTPSASGTSNTPIRLARREPKRTGINPTSAAAAKTPIPSGPARTAIRTTSSASTLTESRV